jgi:hypothetical protein
MAFTAVLMSSNAVITMTSTSPIAVRTRFRNSMPSMPGIRTSVMMRPGWTRSASASASSALGAVTAS